MPNKTIYVKDEDLNLFEEAEKLGGESLSGVIAEALRRFVDVKKSEAQGLQEFTLSVGTWRFRGDDNLRKVRFTGRLLAEAEVLTGQTSDRRDRGTDYKIYQTQAGKVLVWWKNWTRWERENDTADYAVLDQLPDYNDEVVGKMHGDILGPVELPGSLLQDAAEALGEELVEFVE